MAEQAVLDAPGGAEALFTSVLLAEMETIAVPLLRLDERVRASIVALLGAAELITSYEAAQREPAAPVRAAFDTILASLHGKAASLVADLRAPEPRGASAQAPPLAALIDVLHHLGLPARLPRC